MNLKSMRMASTIALILAGCGTTPAEAPMPVDAAGVDSVDYAFQGGGYGLAAVTDDAVTIKSCEASSVRNDYFRASYATDGNLSSAWAPAAADTAPTLTLTLPAVKRLTRVSLKQSHTNVTVDVSVSKGGAAWTTVATGLAPVATTLSDLDLTACEGDRVKLTFHGQGLADLQVCEVQLGCTAAAPAPSPTPQPSGSPAPVPVPVPTPTPAPVTPPCTISGGGWLPSPARDDDHDICFAFVVDLDGDRCGGSIDVDDLTANTKFHGTITEARRHGNVVTFAGHLEDGQTFTTTVVDESKHSRQDTISFATSGGTLFCGCLESDADLTGRIRIKPVREQVEWALIGLVAEREDEHHVRFKLDDYEARCREAAKHRKGKKPKKH